MHVWIKVTKAYPCAKQRPMCKRLRQCIDNCGVDVLHAARALARATLRFGWRLVAAFLAPQPFAAAVSQPSEQATWQLPGKMTTSGTAVTNTAAEACHAACSSPWRPHQHNWAATWHANNDDGWRRRIDERRRRWHAMPSANL